MAYDRAAKWWNEEENEAARVRRGGYARHTSRKATVEWEEYATATK